MIESLAAIYRPAALFLTNKENFVADNGDFAGTVIYSSNMLRACALRSQISDLRFEIPGSQVALPVTIRFSKISLPRSQISDLRSEIGMKFEI